LHYQNKKNLRCDVIGKWSPLHKKALHNLNFFSFIYYGLINDAVRSSGYAVSYGRTIVNVESERM
jgi:hypothetical protein